MKNVFRILAPQRDSTRLLSSNERFLDTFDDVIRRWAWLPAGLCVTAAIAAAFGSQRAWIILGGYALFNGLGTVLVVGLR